MTMPNTSAPASTASSSSPGSAGAATRVNGPPKYALMPPARHPISIGLLGRDLTRSTKILFHLIRHALGSFDAVPAVVTPLTLSQPAGTIDVDMLKVCEHLANDSEARLTKLESKASGLLSLIALVVPLTASAAVFIRQHSLPRVTASITLALDLSAIVFFLVGLVAALRALAVRGHEALFLNAVIDPGTDQVRPASADFYGRGLLYVAAARQAICDHIADFVRGAQVFLVIGVALAAIAATAVLFEVHEDKQTIQGVVTIDRSSIDEIERNMRAASADSDMQLSRVETEIQALRQKQLDLATRAQLDSIAKELEQLRLRIAASAPARTTRTNNEEH